jgi:UDP-3-O-[3-hydroxymyristoyl] glucosamine N-acyltransferase
MEFRAPAPENAAPLSAAQVASMLGGQVDGDAEVMIAAVSSLVTAQSDAASYWMSRTAVESCAAAVVLVPLADSAAESIDLPAALRQVPARIQVARPDLAAALLAQHFDLAVPRWIGIHERAFVDPSAEVGPGCTIQAGGWVGPGCKIGAGCVLHPNVVLEAGTQLGPGCVIEANSVLGSDGFGYVWSGQKHEKVPQQGSVQVGAGVEIGACSTIDRGTYGPTVIGDGCILDNQVQVGHNCQLGRFVVLCAQAGLAGSTEVGDGAVFGGRAATVGHLRIGAGVRMAGASVATKDVPDGATVAGYPAWDIKSETRVIARIRRLIRD